MSLRDRLSGGGPSDEQAPEVIPTGNTVDAEVVPVKLDLATEHSPAPSDALGNAIAAHFDIEPQNITGFVLAVEHTSPEGSTLSSAWSMAAPVWRLKSFARELLAHLERT